MDDDSLLLPLTMPHRSLMDFSSSPLNEPRDLMSFMDPFRWAPITRQLPRAPVASPPLLVPSTNCSAILPPPLPSPAVVSFVPLGVPRLPIRIPHSAGRSLDPSRHDPFDVDILFADNPPEDTNQSLHSADPPPDSSSQHSFEEIMELMNPHSALHEPVNIEVLETMHRHLEDLLGNADLDPQSSDPPPDYARHDSFEEVIEVMPSGETTPPGLNPHSANPPPRSDPHSSHPSPDYVHHDSFEEVIEVMTSGETTPPRPNPHSANLQPTPDPDSTIRELLDVGLESMERSSTLLEDASPPWPFLIQVSPPDRVPIEPPPVPDVHSLNFSYPGSALRRNVTPPLPRNYIPENVNDNELRLPLFREDRFSIEREELVHREGFGAPSNDHFVRSQWPPSTVEVNLESLPNNGLGFEVERFVSSVPRDLICPICLSVMNYPVETPCSHVFCYSCIQKSLTHRLRCPVDRKALCLQSLRPLPAIVHRILGSLVVRCRHTECGREVELENLETHENHCAFS